LRYYRSIVGTVRSELALPLCPSPDPAAAAWSIAVGPAPVPLAGADSDVAVTRDGERAEMSWEGMAVIGVDLADRTIVVHPCPPVDGATVAGLVVDHVLPRIAADSGLVLHAAAVVGADGRTATLVVGPSGAGKSTLVVEWCRAGRPLLGDDTIRMDGATAMPSWVGPRLWPSACVALGLAEEAGRAEGGRSTKRRLGAADGIVLAERPAEVTKIVLLGAPSSSRLQAVRLLAEQTLNLGVFDPVLLLDRITALVNAVPQIEAREPWWSPVS
jgi:hypothetical protein